MNGTVELICMIIRVGIQCAAQLIPCIVPILRSCYMLPVWYFANLSFCHFAIFHWGGALELIHWKVTTLHIYAGVHWSGLHWKVNCVALLHRICAVHCTDWLSIERWPQCYHSESHRMGSAGWGGQDAVRMVGVDRNCDSVQWWEVNWLTLEGVLRSLLGSILTCPGLHGFDLICFPVS